MRLNVDPHDELPIYRQVMNQLISAIASGHFNPGDRLPSHRRLAADLRIAPLTIKKAYDELSKQGYVSIVHGGGTYVTDIGGDGLTEEEKMERLNPILEKLVHEAVLLKLEASAVCALVDGAFEAMEHDF